MENITDKQAAEILLSDFVVLANECKKALDKAHFKAEDTEQASVALFLCEQVLERWTKKNS
jgi:hypothetical protein